MHKRIFAPVFMLASIFGLQQAAAEDGRTTLLLPDRTGVIGTITSSPSFDFNGPFFQSLGTNGRSCGSCHRAAQGWGISAGEVTARFAATQGLDPIFWPGRAPYFHNGSASTLADAANFYDVRFQIGFTPQEKRTWLRS